MFADILTQMKLVNSQIQTKYFQFISQLAFSLPIILTQQQQQFDTNTILYGIESINSLSLFNSLKVFTKQYIDVLQSTSCDKNYLIEFNLLLIRSVFDFLTILKDSMATVFFMSVLDESILLDTTDEKNEPSIHNQVQSPHDLNINLDDDTPCVSPPLPVISFSNSNYINEEIYNENTVPNEKDESCPSIKSPKKPLIEPQENSIKKEIGKKEDYTDVSTIKKDTNKLLQEVNDFFKKSKAESLKNEELKRINIIQSQEEELIYDPNKISLEDLKQEDKPNEIKREEKKPIIQHEVNKEKKQPLKEIISPEEKKIITDPSRYQFMAEHNGLICFEFNGQIKEGDRNKHLRKYYFVKDLSHSHSSVERDYNIMTKCTYKEKDVINVKSNIFSYKDIITDDYIFNVEKTLLEKRGVLVITKTLSISKSFKGRYYPYILGIRKDFLSNIFITFPNEPIIIPVRIKRSKPKYYCFYYNVYERGNIDDILIIEIIIE
ncbi:hypothetical protein EDI_163750 [Entamoeba dispar SAW760]|uniref:Uncharacterized protein n=1 Tax=Entamoeba dispar (strain ATCC PRA-260 / SAW760) TaxID=370354 RepID=B0EUP2_ENTDS|nr:uncharacterized protein EDI_163750 [Entamoeba dispar SAW760]EDR21756.1 hypothetical protein EDI_163750 [Entamoeba dispar SAW760]|eukprot:EDR21756.1 hypothetical protein EDI_163750 [Entamoeba dispar SAW760]